MGMTCLTVCPECSRHLRCEERAYPFCGARVSSEMRILEYRVKTRLSRAHAFSLGASLTLAGFVSSCEQGGGPVYGAPCNPPACSPPVTGGNAGAAASGGHPNLGGGGGSPSSGGIASGGTAGGGASTGGTAVGGAGGDATSGEAGQAGDAAGGSGGDASEPTAGAGGDGGAGGAD